MLLERVLVLVLKVPFSCEAGRNEGRRKKALSSLMKRKLDLCGGEGGLNISKMFATALEFDSPVIPKGLSWSW